MRSHPMVPAVLLVVSSLVAGCGDTDSDEPGGKQGTTTEVTSDSGGADADQSPDNYNDEDNDGQQPAEEDTDTGSG
ncbi:MAG: hypothetical protein ACJ739_00535 [Acidimicrobiales bacterium]